MNGVVHGHPTAASSRLVLAVDNLEEAFTIPARDYSFLPARVVLTFLTLIVPFKQ
jgi:hypothetical protein